MTDMITNEKPSLYQIELLLPWHAAGTLNSRDANEVEKTLAQDKGLARRFAMMREEMNETILLNETLGAPSARATENLAPTGRTGATLRYLIFLALACRYRIIGPCRPVGREAKWGPRLRRQRASDTGGTPGAARHRTVPGIGGLATDRTTGNGPGAAARRVEGRDTSPA
jgi:anti-sigma factor RsiW